MVTVVGNHIHNHIRKRKNKSRQITYKAWQDIRDMSYKYIRIWKVMDKMALGGQSIGQWVVKDKIKTNMVHNDPVRTWNFSLLWGNQIPSGNNDRIRKVRDKTMSWRMGHQRQNQSRYDALWSCPQSLWETNAPRKHWPYENNIRTNQDRKCTKHCGTTKTESGVSTMPASLLPLCKN